MTLLDREPLALQCALLNAALNGVAAHASATGAQPLPLDALLPHLGPNDMQQLEQQRRYLAEVEAQRRASHAAASTSAPGSSNTRSSSESSSSSSGGSGVVSAEVYDWSRPAALAPHDVMLVCDCLYEAFSVQPVAAVAPRLLSRRDGRLLLADPPDRARHNRECFLDILCEAGGDFLLEESGERQVRLWESSKGDWRQHAVALMALRRNTSGDTVGVKLDWRQG